MSLDTLLEEVRACTVCEHALPLGPRPVLRAEATARVAIIGQAPGTKVHASGVPWDDPSGDRLRSWLDVEPEAFYDASRFAIIPMGLCYPGRHTSGSGDAPPRPECAPLWHERLFAELPQIRLFLLVGSYAQKHYLGKRRKRTLTETVRAYQEYGPRFFPMPHPSWRVSFLLKKNPWIEAEVVPALREAVQSAFREADPG